MPLVPAAALWYRCGALQGRRGARRCGLMRGCRELWLPAAGLQCVSAAGVLSLRRLKQWLERSEEDQRSA